jgi:glycine oxidase
MSVLIIGGGIIGLSIGWQLQRKNIATMLLDGSTGISTSHVAAGMLAPYSEANLNHPEWLNLAKASLALFPQFLSELSDDSGMHIALEQSGTLLVATDYDDVQWLKQKYLQKKNQNIETTLLSKEAAHELEPLLSSRISQALWIKEEAQIDNRALLSALKTAYMQKGGLYLAPLSVTSILREGKRVVGVECSEGQIYRAEKVIVCAGAYSQHFGAAVRPEKGEILTLKSPYPLRHMIRSPRVYLTPKPKNILRIGATSHEAEYDLSMSASAVRKLLQEAWELLPAIDEMQLFSCEVGLRPLTSNNLPIIEERNGLLFATGHGRSGILLAPYTAQEVCMKLILNGEEKDIACERLSEILEPQKGVAVAVNQEVIFQKNWPETYLKEGDHVDVVLPFQGG